MESPPTMSGAAERACESCGARLSPQARYCHRCGTAVGATRPDGPAPGTTAMLPWGMAALALIALVSLLAGQFFAARGARAAGTADGTTPRAPDISAMSPQERADRLFQRVMTYDTEGRADSAQFFAPMAIGALEAIEPRTIHTRFDLGRVALVAGDTAMAAAQADTMLRSSSTHLLGLVLGALVADAKTDTVARRQFEARFLAAEATERARALPEYSNHSREIDAMSVMARSRKQ